MTKLATFRAWELEDKTGEESIGMYSGARTYTMCRMVAYLQ